jgi:hypothetical protein
MDHVRLGALHHSQKLIITLVNLSTVRTELPSVRVRCYSTLINSIQVLGCVIDIMHQYRTVFKAPHHSVETGTFFSQQKKQNLEKT